MRWRRGWNEERNTNKKTHNNNEIPVDAAVDMDCDVGVFLILPDIAFPSFLLHFIGRIAWTSNRQTFKYRRAFLCVFTNYYLLFETLGEYYSHSQGDPFYFQRINLNKIAFRKRECECVCETEGGRKTCFLSSVRFLTQSVWCGNRATRMKLYNLINFSAQQRLSSKVLHNFRRPNDRLETNSNSFTSVHASGMHTHTQPHEAKEL